MLVELLDCHSGRHDEGPQRAGGELAVLTNGKAGDMPPLEQDDVTAALPVHPSTGASEHFDGLGARENGPFRHYTATSISRMVTVSGMPASARASMQAPMA